MSHPNWKEVKADHFNKHAWIICQRPNSRPSFNTYIFGGCQKCRVAASRWELVPDRKVAGGMDPDRWYRPIEP
jgi:hypothetical protein